MAVEELLSRPGFLLLARSSDPLDELRRMLGDLGTVTRIVGSAAAAGDEPRDRVVDPDDIVRRHIEHALAACKGRIDGPFGAAHKLAINPHTLRARMRKLGVDWRRYRPS